MKRPSRKHRLPRAPSASPSLRNWEKPADHLTRQMKSDAVVEMGWGRLIFAHTFADNQKLAQTLCEEKPGQRDIAIYLRDPHVVLSLAPQELFLDPSHTYRLSLYHYRPAGVTPRGFVVRRPRTRQDIEAMNRIYAACNMVQTDADFVLANLNSRLIMYRIAQDLQSGRVLGTVTGIDHVAAFSDSENGASLWSLAVDPQTPSPGVGEALVRHVAERYLARGRDYLDLSVMYNNRNAIALYERVGFRRVPAFCLKHKNAINEPLFIGPVPAEDKLNIYAKIIINEARQRGIAVEVLDEQANYFSLTLGGRTIACRESLSQLTTAIAMSRCDDKRVTLRILKKAGLNVPEQRTSDNREEDLQFLETHKRVVVKPARGEQGAGISVDVRTPEDMDAAIEAARHVCDQVILEQFVEGQDLRIIVIDNAVVAAAVRKPAHIVGTGEHTIQQLIEKQSRRRAAATGGESSIPLDAETRRCVRSAGYEMDSILPANEALTVRKTANLHTGGTIHDVTGQLHPKLAEAAVIAARALEIPVVGLDFLVPDVKGEQYTIIEANERPGLANHEPQPTAERFMDFLFPETRCSN